MRFHVDDVMYSNVNANINEKIKYYMTRNYGNNCEVNAGIRKVHKYFGITLDITKKLRRKLRFTTILRE